MGRQGYIARSIARAIINHAKPQRHDKRGWLAFILGLFSTFFSVYQLTLQKFRPADFANLRRNHWRVEDNDYVQSFSRGEGGDVAEDVALRPIGDMGFSGSTFYATSDSKYLVKSIPRRSEYTFFRDELLTSYVQHMASHAESMLVRITDFLWAPGMSLGKLFGLAPSHHIVMENIMYGQEEAKKRGEVSWESWDLKPTSYFYPERDIANGRLTSEATKDQLADEFHDKIILDEQSAASFFAALEADTQLLASHNAVDYSLFLVRMQVQGKRPEEVVDDSGSSGGADASVIPTEPPAVPPGPPTWRTGAASADGKHLYRAALLDFFWAKHKPQAKIMTLLVKMWNVLVSREGPMSITTEAGEYRERFLRMCREYVEIRASSQD
ncbi:SAICAR synthase-like protein [Thozetella sp. PMI_491]|nr:SAICAR synthase-like protein [Thozetella sp. PMI_491]